MNTPGNARSTASKNKIKMSYLNLLEQGNPSEISVGQICKVAGVNRTTFYSHYSCIDDLVDSIQKDLHVNMGKVLLPDNEIFDQNFALNMIVSALDNTKRFKNIHKNYLDRMIELDYVVDLCEEIRKRYLPMILQGQELSPEQENHFFNFCKNGIVGIIREWVKDDCKEDTQSVAFAILHIMSRLRF